MVFPTSDQREDVRRRPTDRSPVMYQSWKDLLFLHWEYSPEVIQKTLPEGLFVDTFQGGAYLGLVPFYMCDVRPRFCPPIWGVSNFLEMNLRTYVFDSKGRPGVWFYSLDANQKLAVWCARTFFNLPYFNAKMSATKEKYIHYKVGRPATDEVLSTEIKYACGKELPPPDKNSLEFFLIERYLLFAVNGKKQIFSGQVHHSPYPLHEVDYEIYKNSALTLAGFLQPLQGPDHAIMSPGVSVDIFKLERVDLP